MSETLEARMGSRGQVTIPREIREAYALAPGDEVIFVRVDGGYAVYAKNRSPSAVFDRLAGRSREGSALSDYERSLAETLQKEDERTKTSNSAETA